MKSPGKRLSAEIAVILLLAAVAGAAWNHRLLSDAWSGKALPLSPPPSAADQGGIPLPLGLMQVKELSDRGEAVIVDARDAQAYEAGHIRGALSLPRADAERRLPDFTAKTGRDKLLIVYCSGFGCPDSMELGKRLIRAGYRQVYVYEGGYPEWRDAGYPVARGKR